MTRTLRSMAVGLVLALSGQIISVLPASADITEADRATIETMLEDYIRANPELVREVLVDLAQREAEAAMEVAFTILQNDDGDPFMGNPDAGTVIYEFSDYKS